MNYFTVLCLFVVLSNALQCCKAQSNTNRAKKTNIQQQVGGGCDGCELMFVGMPASLASTDTSAAWNAGGEQLLITGRVLKLDGKTPAAGVTIYYWQTDAQGYYTAKPATPAAAKRHGYIRGWVKTGIDGKYSIYTIKPAPYPDSSMPAHIHTSIKEPGIDDEYYIDEFVFDDDVLLTKAKRRVLENRGGSGILKPVIHGNVRTAEHDIILGLNIPNYPL